MGVRKVNTIQTYQVPTKEVLAGIGISHERIQQIKVESNSPEWLTFSITYMPIDSRADASSD
jgi:hypothetical protein